MLITRYESVNIMRFYLSLILLIAASVVSYAGTNNDRIAGSRADYLKNKIAAGDGHTLEIRNGQLWAWGQNNNGQLGDGTTANKNNPTQIGTADNWICVTAGAYHSLGIRADGSLWAWGSNSSGQLGDGTTTNKNAPARIGTDNTWAAVVTNGNHTLAVKANGTLWAWGNNSNGQLGDGTTTNRNAPLQIGTARDWVTIAPGAAHSLAIKANGTLWAWGNNAAGQLGDGTKTTRNTPVQVGTANNWMNVATGAQHTIALQANGTLWAWGKNSDGQLGDSTYTHTTKPVQIDTARNWTGISAGAYHNLALKANGTLWAWGKNDDGQLGDSTNTKRNVPVHVDKSNRWKAIYAGTIHSLGIKANGAVMAWGDNGFGQLGDGANTDKNYVVQVHVSGDEWIYIGGGDAHSIGLKADGTLWVWGWNDVLPVQIGSTNNWVSVSVGPYYILAISADGTLWAWGDNSSGQLGIGNTISTSIIVQVGTENNWVSISAGPGGGAHSLAIKSDGTLWGWGHNNYGQIGIGVGGDKISPIQITNADNWVSISSGHAHSTGLKSDGTFWSWGKNDYGQLGDNDPGVNKYSPVQIGMGTDWTNVSAGRIHTLGKKSDGTIWSWGGNAWYALGHGSNISQSSIPLKIGSNDNWVDITTGHNHNFVINSDGALWTWGFNGLGRLGVGNNSHQHIPVRVGTDNSWAFLCGGWQHSLGIKSDRIIICGTGVNNDGQLGNGTKTTTSTFVCVCGPSKIHLKPITKKNCIGDNAFLRITSKYTTSYQWQVNIGSGWINLNNNVIYSGVNADSLVVANADTSYKSYWYRCIAHNCSDSTISDSAQIVFNTSTISLHPQDSSVCANTNAGFSVGATGGPFAHQWQVNDGSSWSDVTNTGMYSGADNDTLLLKAAPTTVNGYRYRCIVGGVCPPDDTSDEAVLTITTKYNAPAVSSQPTNARIMGNSGTTFTVASADPDLSYQWQVNDGNNWTDISNAGVYSDATTDTLYLTGVPYAMNGYQYRCLLIRPCAPIATSSPATLTVDTFPAGIATTNADFKTITLHPNPNNGTFIIEAELTRLSKYDVNITILSNMGQVVYREAVQSSEGKINHTINTGKDLVPGNYMLKLDYDGEQDFKRFVIIK